MTLLLGFTGPPIAVALAFSLAVMGAVSLVLFWSRSRRLDVATEIRRLRTFKNEAKAAAVALRSGDSSWVKLGSISIRNHPGLEGEIHTLENGSIELLVTPKYAGRFDGLVVRLHMGDVLGLFFRIKEIDFEDLTVESLPLSIQTPPRPLSVSPLVSGENPAGRSGWGQELYSVGEYQDGLDPRDILWKRAAWMTDGSLPMRFREANVRKLVSIVVAVGSGMDDVDHHGSARGEEKATTTTTKTTTTTTTVADAAEAQAKRMDLVAEALAKVGRVLLLIGTALEVTFWSRGEVRRARASNLPELADAAIGLGTGRAVNVELGTLLSTADLLILGPAEFEDQVIARRGTPKIPIVLICADGVVPESRTRGVLAFTGAEDLAGLAAEVLAR